MPTCLSIIVYTSLKQIISFFSRRLKHIYFVCDHKDVVTGWNVTDNSNAERDVANQAVKYIERNGFFRVGSMDYNMMNNDNTDCNDTHRHGPEFDTSAYVDGYGGGSECVIRASPSRNVYQVEHSKEGGVTINETEDYHLMMSVLEAANSESQKQYLRKTLLEIRNKFLMENRKAPIVPGEPSGITFTISNCAICHSRLRRSGA
jgi:hypothetical protein